MKVKIKKILNILKKILIFSLLLVILFLIIIQFFFPANYLKKEAFSYLKDKYGLDLKMEDINIRLFNKIEISDFGIKNEEFELDSLLTFEKLTLDYDLVDFLVEQKINITKIELSHPKIKIQKYDSLFNFEHLIAKFSDAEKALSKIDSSKSKLDSDLASKKSKTDSSKFKINLNLESLTIKDLKLCYQDSSQKYELDKLNLNIKNLSYDGKIYSLDYFLGINSILKMKRLNDFSSIPLDLNFEGKVDTKKVANSTKLKIYEPSIFFAGKKLQLQPQNKLLFSLIYDQIAKKVRVENFSLDLEKFLKVKGDFLISLADNLNVKANLEDVFLDIDAAYQLLSGANLVILDKLSLKEASLNIAKVKYDLANGKSFLAILGAKLKSAKISYDGFRILNLSNSLKNAEINLDNKNAENYFENQLEISELKFKNFKIKKLKQNLAGKLSSDFYPKEIIIKNSIGDFWGINAKDSLNLSFKNPLTSYQVAEILDKAKLDYRLFSNSDNLNVLWRNLKQEPYLENLGSFWELKYQNDDLRVSNRFKSQLNIADMFKNKDLESKFALSIKPSEFLEKKKVLARKLNFSLNDLLKIDLEDGYYDLTHEQLTVDSFKLMANASSLKNVAKNYLKDLDYYNLKFNLAGKLHKLDLKKLNSYSYLNLPVNFSLGADSLIFKEFKLKNLFLSANSTVQDKNISLKANNKANFSYNNPKFPIKNKKFKNSFTIFLKDFQRLSLRDFQFSLEDLLEELNLNSTLYLSNLYENTTLELNFKNDLNQKYLRELAGPIEGGLLAKNTVLIKDSVLAFDAKMIFDKISTSFKNDKMQVDLKNFQGKIAISEKIDLRDFSFVGLINSMNHNYINYLEGKEKDGQLGFDYLRVNFGKIHLELTDFLGSIFIEQNKITLKDIYFNVLKGNCLGNLTVLYEDSILKLENLLDELRINSSFTASNINTDYLYSDKLKKNRENNLNFSYNINVKGISLNKGYNFNGKIFLTNFSNEQAGVLLDFIGKNSNDKSILMLKNILDIFPGIKLVLFQFNIKNNFIYTLVELYKPWYLFYFPLAEEISLSKQSIKFYLDTYLKKEEF